MPKIFAAFFFYFIILSCNYQAIAGKKPTIVVSITPVASLVSMIVKDEAKVVILNNSSGCPHEHSYKPSDILQLKKSDLLIYIDDDFDIFASALATSYDGIKVKISDLPNINFSSTTGKKNWHFWLDINNAITFQTELSKILKNKFPELKGVIDKNLKTSVSKLSKLDGLKQQLLLNFPPAIIVSESLEHFFTAVKHDKIYFVPFDNGSLRSLRTIEDLAKNQKIDRIVTDSEQNPETLKKFGKQIITIESENWSIDHNHGGEKEKDHYHNLSELYIIKYREFIKLMH